MKTFVIAGNNNQAMEWVAKDITAKATISGAWRSISDYIIVSETTNLRGFQDPHGVFVGTWRERPDIEEIVDILFLSCIHVNRDLERIRQEVKLKSKKPTPIKPSMVIIKSRSASGSWHIYDTNPLPFEARVADIRNGLPEDAFRNITRKVNGGNLST